MGSSPFLPNHRAVARLQLWCSTLTTSTFIPKMARISTRLSGFLVRSLYSRKKQKEVFFGRHAASLDSARNASSTCYIFPTQVLLLSDLLSLIHILPPQPSSPSSCCAQSRHVRHHRDGYLAPNANRTSLRRDSKILLQLHPGCGDGTDGTGPSPPSNSKIN